MKKIIALTVMAMFLGIASMMASTPIQWRMSVRMTTPDRGEMILKAYIEPGWHLYGTTMPDGGPAPTTFDTSACKGLEVTGKPVPSVDPVSKHEEAFDMTLTYWARNVNFRIPFKVTDQKALYFETKVRFMGCNDATCLPPATVTLNARVPVEARVLR